MGQKIKNLFNISRNYFTLRFKPNKSYLCGIKKFRTQSSFVPVSVLYARKISAAKYRHSATTLIIKNRSTH